MRRGFFLREAPATGILIWQAGLHGAGNAERDREKSKGKSKKNQKKPTSNKKAN